MGSSIPPRLSKFLRSPYSVYDNGTIQFEVQSLVTNLYILSFDCGLFSLMFHYYTTTIAPFRNRLDL